MKVSKSYGRQSVEGNNLRKALSREHTSCKDLAKLMCVDLVTVYYWRYRGVSATHASDVADLLNVTPALIASKRRNGKGSNVKRKTTAANQVKTQQAEELRMVLQYKTETPVVTSDAIRRINLKLMRIVVDRKLTEEQEHVVFALAANFAEENAA